MQCPARASSSRACAWAASESSWPASIRASSSTRSSSASRVTELLVTTPSSSLMTRKWWWANAATCGRCVTASTWAFSASRASRRPTSTAALPPMPASTSSNTRVGTVVRSASTTSSASISRDSSPPLAPLASGRGAEPLLAAKSSSTSSRPCGPGDGVGRRLDADVEVRRRHRELGELGVDEVGQPSSGLAAQLAEPLGQAADLGPETIALGLQLGDGVVVGAELAEAGGGLLLPGEHVVEGRSVLALQRR